MLHEVLQETCSEECFNTHRLRNDQTTHNPEEGKMKVSILITNHYLGCTEATHEDHNNCDVLTQECCIGDPSPHLRLAAIARGEKRKHGIKISDLTLEEVKALAEECNEQIYFTSSTHLDDGFSSTRHIHYALKRLHNRLTNLQKAMGETK